MLKEIAIRLGLKKETPPTPIPTAGDFINQYVKPEDRVVVVGPSESIFRDATLLLACHLIGQSPENDVLVCDPKNSAQNTNHPLAMGYGDLSKYEQQLDVMRAQGLPLAGINWLGPESHALKTGLAPKSVDAILDHNTAAFLSEGIQLGRFENIIQGYAQSLKPGGSLILQTNEAYFPSTRKKPNTQLRTTLINAGLTPEFHTVRDEITLPVTEEFSNIFNTLLHTLMLTEYDKHYAVVEHQDNPSGLRFPVPDHNSPILVVATKTK